MHRQGIKGDRVENNVGIHGVDLDMVALELRSSFGTPLAIYTIEQFHQRCDTVLPNQVLGENIRGVNLPTHLAQLYSAASHLFLNPKCVSGDMAQLAKALPCTYAHRGGAVSPYPDRQLYPEIAQDTLLS